MFFMMAGARCGTVALASFGAESPAWHRAVRQVIPPAIIRGECNMSLKPTPKVRTRVGGGRPRNGRGASPWVNRRGGLTLRYIPQSGTSSRMTFRGMRNNGEGPRLNDDGGGGCVRQPVATGNGLLIARLGSCAGIGEAASCRQSPGKGFELAREKRLGVSRPLIGAHVLSREGQGEAIVLCFRGADCCP